MLDSKFLTEVMFLKSLFKYIDDTCAEIKKKISNDDKMMLMTELPLAITLLL